jgi:transposase
MKTRKICFVGVDTHKFSHTAAIIDETFTLLGIAETQALPSCYPNFIKHIAIKARGARLIFGLEDVRGMGASLFAFLRSRGLDVREINPVETKRERSHKLHPDKSDPDDALDIARVLGQQWKDLPLPHLDPTILALQQLNRQRDDLVHQLVSAKNRLHALLHQTYPGYQKFFLSPFHSAALAFWKRYPTPAHLKGQDSNAIAAALQEHVSALKAKRTAAAIQQQTFDTSIPVAMASAYGTIIPALTDTIEKISRDIKAIEPNIEQVLQQTPYKLHTMEGVGIINAAQIVAQVAPIERFANAGKLARFIGIAPRKWGSARRIRHRSSLRGRRSLHQTFYLMALSQIALNRNGKPRCPRARSYYLRKVKEKNSKAIALKCLQRRLVDIVYAMMKAKTEYNPKMSKSKNNRIYD